MSHQLYENTAQFCGVALYEAGSAVIGHHLNLRPRLISIGRPSFEGRDTLLRSWAQIQAVTEALLEHRTLTHREWTSVVMAVEDGEEWRQWLSLAQSELHPMRGIS